MREDFAIPPAEFVGCEHVPIGRAGDIVRLSPSTSMLLSNYETHFTGYEEGSKLTLALPAGVRSVKQLTVV